MYIFIDFKKAHGSVGREVLYNILIEFCKVKVKLSLYLTKHDAKKMYRGSGGIAVGILDLETRWR
jgi:hypothetical protein